MSATMTRMWLEKLDAPCNAPPGLDDWARTQPSAEAAAKATKRVDHLLWLLWGLSKTEAERRRVLYQVALKARPAGLGERVRRLITIGPSDNEVAEAWGLSGEDGGPFSKIDRFFDNVWRIVPFGAAATAYALYRLSSMGLPSLLTGALEALVPALFIAAGFPLTWFTNRVRRARLAERLPSFDPRGAFASMLPVVTERFERDDGREAGWLSEGLVDVFAFLKDAQTDE